MSFSISFDAEKISKKFLVPVVIFREIHGREVVSFNRDASLTAYNYLRRIIVLFLVSHCIHTKRIITGQMTGYKLLIRKFA